MSKESPVLYKALRPLAALYFKIYMRPKVFGIENIPKHGSAVLAGNHAKSWDCFMFFVATRRCIHFLSKQELFKGFGKYFFRAAGLIPVDRSRRNPQALSTAITYLQNGSLVAIFPEGKVNHSDSPLLPFKPGAVKMAKEANAPIIPFIIKGKYDRKGERTEIHFLPPYTVGDETIQQENEKFYAHILSNLTK